MIPGNRHLALMVLAIILAMLPLLELADRWESFESNPEFVSLCTAIGIALGILSTAGRAILRRLGCGPVERLGLRACRWIVRLCPDILPLVVPPIRAPIRI